MFHAIEIARCSTGRRRYFLLGAIRAVVVLPLCDFCHAGGWCESYSDTSGSCYGRLIRDDDAAFATWAPKPNFRSYGYAKDQPLFDQRFAHGLSDTRSGRYCVLNVAGVAHLMQMIAEVRDAVLQPRTPRIKLVRRPLGWIRTIRQPSGATQCRTPMSNLVREQRPGGSGSHGRRSARLKGGPGRPNLKPDGMERGTDP
jgi:hypothetical protein